MPHGWPARAEQIPFEQLVAERLNTTHMFRGVNHGGWTEVLCTSEPQRQGVASFEKLVQ